MGWTAPAPASMCQRMIVGNESHKGAVQSLTLRITAKSLQHRSNHAIIMWLSAGSSADRNRSTVVGGVIVGQQADYSALILAARITCAHFEMSLSMRAANSVGELATASKPRPANFSAMSG